jgi:NAD(P)-dependent dehydrogenase (short-subunit alcohol dehydrogenase family)
MRVAMITTDGSIMARGITRCLLEEDWRVALYDINKDAVIENAEVLGSGPNVSWHELDFRDVEQCKAAVAQAVETYGAVNAMVNLGGGVKALGIKRNEFTDMTPEDCRGTTEANLMAIINCCHAVLPHMIERGKGGIVNIASGSGLRGRAMLSVYSANKAAIIAFCQLTAQEVAPHGIRVNAITPGSAESRWEPDVTRIGNRDVTGTLQLGRRTMATDIGSAAAFLLSDKSKHITGTCLDASGGTSLH